MGYKIPEKIHTFNVYKGGTKLLGVAEEVTLPDFEALTTTLSGAGIIGELESATIGHFSSMEIEVPFRTMDTGMFLVADPTTATDLTFRGSEQCMDSETGQVSFRSMRVVVRGKAKGITGGKLKQGNGTESSIKLEVQYILIEIDKKVMIELDKLNTVYKLNGKDLLADVRRMC